MAKIDRIFLEKFIDFINLFVVAMFFNTTLSTNKLFAMLTAIISLISGYFWAFRYYTNQQRRKT